MTDRTWRPASDAVAKSWLCMWGLENGDRCASRAAVEFGRYPGTPNLCLCAQHARALHKTMDTMWTIAALVRQ
jgi:hypothetical protein